MSEPVRHLSFEDRVLFIFDHSAEGPEWHTDPAAPYWDGPAALTAEYVTRLFEDPASVLEGFTDAEINKGLWYLISPGLGEHMLCLDEPTLSLESRLRVVRSCESLFLKLFVPRCSPHLSHRDWADAAPLNSVCYMWWDIMPVYGGVVRQDRQALHETALSTMAAVLELDSLACQESALHGLGHWHSGFPEQVEAMVDRFLKSRPLIGPELSAYAQSARCGCLL